MSGYNVALEYMRDRFMDGTLDVSGSYESLRGFVAIFAGEMEAIIAIQNNQGVLEDWRTGEVDEKKLKELLTVAKLTTTNFDEYEAWRERIHAK